MSMQIIKQLSDAITRDRARLNSLKDQHFKDVIEPQLRRFIGSCWRYRNSYGPGKRWWLYVKIVGYSDSSFDTLEAERDSHGQTTIKRRHQHFISIEGQEVVAAPLMDGYESISRSDFNRAFGSMNREIGGLAKK